MAKRLIKYCFCFFILLTTGYSYLSAASINLNGSKDAGIGNAQHDHDFALQSPLADTGFKIDIAENEVEEDESNIPFRVLESADSSPVFHTQTARCFSSHNKKHIPLYLIFCSIRI